MQPATAETVLGDFNNARFTYGGVTSTFFRRDNEFMVRTDGPDGALHEYPIRHTFGVSPLQQYLIPLPDGRLQAFGIAWDSRPKKEGGQRWFHLYPGQNLTHTSPLHWTGIDQNWNHMCAECHSTHLKKNFDLETQRYSTSYAEINVACEACHGPGSNHAAWAKQAVERRQDDKKKGLVVAFDERRSAQWILNPETGNAQRSIPRQGNRELETCARCHARRSQLSNDYVPGQPLGDTHDVSLLDDDLYYADGQIRGEVFEYGSFVQSRMFQKGVACGDCHEPHNLQLRASRDHVCEQCHAAWKYASPKHHFHPIGSRGASCIECHMPTTTYMIVDPRHDHSLRVPRPDLTVDLGLPNACNRCHSDRSAAWAARQVKQWYGHTPEGYQKFATTIHDSVIGSPGATDELLRLAADHDQPAIARASALVRVTQSLTPKALKTISQQLRDSDPMVRAAAATALGGVVPTVRSELLAPLLEDPVRAVRLEAARVLADVPTESLSQERRAALAQGIAGYVASQQLNADRPDAHLNLALIFAAQGQPARAEAALRTALTLEPDFIPASINLADLYRMLQRDQEGESVLRKALALSPGSAGLHHTLGLLLVRTKRLTEALAELLEAAKLDRNDPRYAYAYGIALNSVGQPREAITTLEEVLERHPSHGPTLFAVATFYRDSGQPEKGVRYARKLVELEPENPQYMSLKKELEALNQGG